MSGSTAAATNPAASSPARANADDAPSGDGLGAAAKAKLKGLLAAAFGRRLDPLARRAPPFGLKSGVDESGHQALLAAAP